jgi:hypothetical protein
MNTTDHLDDEQLTALQEGGGTVAQQAHLTTCARCAERADALATVAALVAAPPAAPTEEARDAAIAAAVRSADSPVPLHPRGRRRVPAWVLPAAAVVAFFAIVAALVPLLDRSSDGGRTASDQAQGAAESSNDDSGSDAGGTQDLTRRAAPAAGTGLGAVEDEAELARRVGAAVSTQAQADAASGTAPDPCEAALRDDGSALGPVRLRATLTWRGQPAEVLSDGDRAVVVATGSCMALAAVDLP